MKSLCSCLLLLTASLLIGGCAENALEGQYQLVSRDLPGGATQLPPNIGGWVSWDDGLRTFHVYWKDANGKIFSIGSVARYKLENGVYTETNLYYVERDDINGKPPVYDFSSTTASSPYTFDNCNLHFKLPLHNEPFAEFNNNKTFTAIREGVFVDHWERIGK